MKNVLKCGKSEKVMEIMTTVWPEKLHNTGDTGQLLFWHLFFQFTIMAYFRYIYRPPGELYTAAGCCYGTTRVLL